MYKYHFYGIFRSNISTRFTSGPGIYLLNHIRAKFAREKSQRKNPDVFPLKLFVLLDYPGIGCDFSEIGISSHINLNIYRKHHGLSSITEHNNFIIVFLEKMMIFLLRINSHRKHSQTPPL